MNIESKVIHKFGIGIYKYHGRHMEITIKDESGELFRFKFKDLIVGYVDLCKHWADVPEFIEVATSLENLAKFIRRKAAQVCEN